MEQSRGQKEVLRKCPPAAPAEQSGLVKEQVPSAGLLSHGPPPLHPLSHPRHWPRTSERMGQSRHIEINIQERGQWGPRISAPPRKQLKKKTIFRENRMLIFFFSFTRYSRSCDSIRGMKSCMSLLGLP